MAKRPTEEDLGIEMTPEETEILSRPAPESVEDDVPITQDEETDPASHHLVVPKAETLAPEKPGRVKDPLTGKFVAKEPVRENTAPVPPPGFTDIRALQEERALRQQTEERMNVLLEIMNKRETREAKAAEPAPPQVPDKTLDPLGFYEHQLADVTSRLERYEGETKAQHEARQAQEQQNAETNRIMSAAIPQFNEAVKADPTLPALQSALLESLAREIAFNNRIPIDSVTPDQRAFIERELHNVEQTHIAHALRNNIPLGDYMRNFAAVRGVKLPAQNGTPVGKTAIAGTPKTIAERNAAQQRHLSIGDLPGSAAPAKISAKDVGKMSAKQFAAFAKQLGDAGLDEFMAEVGGIN